MHNASCGFNVRVGHSFWHSSPFDSERWHRLRAMERSLFSGRDNGFKSLASRGSVWAISLIPKGRSGGPRRIAGSARALGCRSSNLGKCVADGFPAPSRWGNLKFYHTSRKQWKPRRAIVSAWWKRNKTSGDQVLREQDTADVIVQEHDADMSIPQEDVRLHHRILAEAQKRTIVAIRRLQSLDVRNFKLDSRSMKNLITTTGEQLPYPPMPSAARTLITTVGFIYLSGVVLDALLYKLSRSALKNNAVSNERDSSRSNSPSGLSMLLERDLRRKESVEWVNMVIGKLWNLYRRALENTMIELLQPIIDDLEKPPYVQKVEVEEFFLGDDPLTVRTVERRTSRRADDLQYHIGVRYAGGARLLLAITLKWGLLSLSVPVGVRGLDVDAEVWVKLRMLPSDPWVGQATWAFVSLPRIKLVLTPFRLVNLMDIPFLSSFLAKLLTEDLPMLFVRPNRNVVDFLQGRVVGPVSKDFKDGISIDGNISFSGELSVTLIESRKMSYIPYLKTDPYCIFNLGEQVIRSKRNSQTSVIGPPGNPVWNQDFKMLVVDPKAQHLSVTLHDTIGFTSYPVGSADISLKTLQDTVPVDRKLSLTSGWGPFPKRFAGELALRLTYKAYVDEDEEVGGELPSKSFKVGDVPGAVEQVQEAATFFKEEAAKVADLFEEKDLAKDMFSSLSPISPEKISEKPLPIIDLQGETREKGPHLSTGLGISAEQPSVTVSKNSGNGAIANVSGGVADIASSNFSARQKDDEKRTSVKVEGGSIRQVLLWLVMVTGLIWIVAADLNLENIFNW